MQVSEIVRPDLLKMMGGSKVISFTIDLQGDSPDFSDAKTIGNYPDIRDCVYSFVNLWKGNRRIVCHYYAEDGFKCELELIRV